MTLLPAVLAFAVTCIAQRALLASKLAERTLDRPNHRSLHVNPTPRTGGLALLAGICAGWLWLVLVIGSLPVWLSALWLASLAAATVSLIDDLRGLPAGVRLAAHFAICAAFLAALSANTTAGPGMIWIALLLVPLVWGINLYNFMDGLDGLAGGMAVMGFGSYALLAALQGGTPLAVVSACVAAAALGFLPYNFAPAKVFLGDVGSIPLGLLAGAIGVVGWQQELWPLWLPLVVFSPFVLDATLTLGRRLLRGARFAEAHREHYYQRLAQSGMGHRNTALLEYGLMALSGVTGLLIVLMNLPAVWMLGALLVIEGVCLVAIDMKWKSRRQSQ